MRHLVFLPQNYARLAPRRKKRVAMALFRDYRRENALDLTITKPDLAKG